MQSTVIVLKLIFLLLFTDKAVPVVNHPVSLQKIDLSKDVTVTCPVTGGYSYQWTTESGSFPSKVTGINTNTLVIPDVRSSDDNTYTCVASNEGGSVFAVTQLTVTGMSMMMLLSSSVNFVAVEQVYQR